MKKKKWLAILLSATLTVATMWAILLTTGGVTAESGDVPVLTTDTYDLDGDGTKDSVYEIANAQQLEWFANRVNNGNGNTNAVLIADIDLTGVTHSPIGVNYSDFTGIFDGRGYTIDNMKFTTAKNGYNNNLTYDYQGLFGVVRGGAVIRNFTVKGEIVISANKQMYIGGAVGLAYEDSKISNVISYVNINDGGTQTADLDQIGGVVGQLGNENNQKRSAASIEHCKYYGTIGLKEADRVGGIAGRGSYYSTIKSCSNYGTVGSGKIGHIAGVAGSAFVGTTVDDCGNYGAVTAAHHDCVGGVVGYANEYSKITNCINAAPVSASKSGETQVYLGGILGYINNSDFASLTGCFNYGKITATGGSNYTGAIVGWVRSGTSAITGNYWYTESCSNAYGPLGTKPAAPTAAIVLKDDDSWTYKLKEENWYILKGNVTMAKVWDNSANAHPKLFIADNSSLNIKEFFIEGLAKLTIYAESEPVLNDDYTVNTAKTKTGVLNITDGRFGHSLSTMIINGGIINANQGMGSDIFNLTVNGGVITANGKGGHAGIGSMDSTENETVITINGGVVRATAASGGCASGIGDAKYPRTQNGTVTVNGGVVIAHGAAEAAGISGKTITINGGTVIASNDSGGAAIGGANGKAAGNITINGGTIKAVSGDGTGNGIGDGMGYSGSTPIKINDFCKISAYGAKAFSATPNIAIGPHARAWGGTTLENVTPVEYESLGAACTGNKAVVLERCFSHEMRNAVYKDEKTHFSPQCKWCGYGYKIENHSYSTTNGACDCGAWQGYYLEYNEASKSFSKKQRTVYNPITSATTTMDEGWYVAFGDVTVPSRISVNGDVHIILADNSTLNASRGLAVAASDNYTITIYACSQPIYKSDGTLDVANTKTGKLLAGDRSNHSSGTAIQGNVVIHGGNIQAIGDGAGIGGYSNTGVNVTIHGGHIYAMGGDTYFPGIGGSNEGNFGTVTINGGNVTAVAGGGAAIGGGDGCKGGAVVINGGTITADGNSYGADGIGGENVKITINGYDKMTVSGGKNNGISPYGKAFTTAPTFSSSLEPLVKAGDSLDNLTKVEYGDLGTALTTNFAATFEKCSSHEPGRAEYLNGEVHNVNCKWCNHYVYPTAHSFSDDDGLCTCGEAWSGSYLEYNPTDGAFDVKTCPSARVMKSGSNDWSKSEYYVVFDGITIDSKVTINKSVKLILADGANLKLSALELGESQSGAPTTLDIYARSHPAIDDDGNLKAAETTTGKITVATNQTYGITMSHSNAQINIHGGVITAESGISGRSDTTGQALGTLNIYGGHTTVTRPIAKSVSTIATNNTALSTATVQIYGGVLDTNSSRNVSGLINNQSTAENDEKGIMGGNGLTTGNLLVKGGFLKASGGNGGDGGIEDDGAPTMQNACNAAMGGAGISATDITISDGYVMAKGGDGGNGGNGAASTGNACNGAMGGAGISATDITISGGYVMAKGGDGGDGGDGGYGGYRVNVGEGANGGIGIDAARVTVSGTQYISAFGGEAGSDGKRNPEFGMETGGSGIGESSSSTSKATNGTAFSNAPTILPNSFLCVFYGANLTELTKAEYGKHAEFCTANRAVVIEKCQTHERGALIYKDENTHGYLCKWCNILFDEQPHSFNANDRCVCSRWSGDYLDYSSANKKFVTKTASDVQYIDTAAASWTDGWYVADGNVTIDGRAVVSGEVHLILADGATLTVTNGIAFADSDPTAIGKNSLTIYAQSQLTADSNTGKLTITSAPTGAAGISVNGGTLTVNGGTLSSAAAVSKGGIKLTDSTLIVNGGSVTSDLDCTNSPVVIAGGRFNAYGGIVSDGTVTVNGGFLTAHGVSGANSIAVTAKNLLVAGGHLVAYGADSETAPAVAISVSDSFDMTGGVATAVGGKGSQQNASAISGTVNLASNVSWCVQAGDSLSKMSNVTSPHASTWAKNAVKIYDGKTDDIVSVEISWTSMEFTYYDEQWDPATHQTAAAHWSAKGGTVSVKNNSTVSASVSFAYNKADEDSAVNGTLSVSSLNLVPLASGTTTLTLSGKPSAAMSNITLGNITVTIKVEKTFEVRTDAELRAALLVGGNIKLMEDIDLEDADKYEIKKDVVIDLNGYDIDVIEARRGTTFMQIDSGVNCTVKNGYLLAGNPNLPPNIFVYNYGTFTLINIEDMSDLFIIYNYGKIIARDTRLYIRPDINGGNDMIKGSGELEFSGNIELYSGFTYEPNATFLPGHYSTYHDFRQCVDTAKYTVITYTEMSWLYNWYVFPTDKFTQNGWTEYDGKRYYFVDGEPLRNEMREIDGYTYAFNSDGSMVMNDIYYNYNVIYFFDSNGHKTAIGWYTDGTDVYYFGGENGCALTGKQTIDGKMYIFYEYGIMCRDRIVYQNGEPYMCGPDGVVLTGGLTWVVNSDNRVIYYYADENGTLQRGWKTIDGKTYYFNFSAMCGWATIDDQKYYFDMDGVMKTGWQQIDGSWYYFDETTGVYDASAVYPN